MEDRKIVDYERYSLAEAGKKIGKSYRTVLRYVQTGIIRAGVRKSNGRLFVSGKELMRFIRTDEY